MLGSLTRKIFGSPNDRKVKATRKIVDAINDLEPEYEALSDNEIIAINPDNRWGKQAAGFKPRLAKMKEQAAGKKKEGEGKKDK